MTYFLLSNEYYWIILDQPKVSLHLHWMKFIDKHPLYTSFNLFEDLIPPSIIDCKYNLTNRYTIDSSVLFLNLFLSNFNIFRGRKSHKLSGSHQQVEFSFYIIICKVLGLPPAAQCRKFLHKWKSVLAFCDRTVLLIIFDEYH